MAGRKAIPIDIKKAKGTNRPFREKIVVPPSSDKPIPPDWLNFKAKRIFINMVGRIGEIGLDSANYTETLALLSSRMEEVERLDLLLNEKGVTYESTDTRGGFVIRERPEVMMREKAARHLHSLLCEFGLSPASAQKVGTKKEKKQMNPFEAFG